MRSLEDLAVTATAQSLLANRDVMHLLQVLCAVERDLANVSACNPAARCAHMPTRSAHRRTREARRWRILF
jgi:hypothetical protein